MNAWLHITLRSYLVCVPHYKRGNTLNRKQKLQLSKKPSNLYIRWKRAYSHVMKSFMVSAWEFIKYWLLFFNLQKNSHIFAMIYSNLWCISDIFTPGTWCIQECAEGVFIKMLLACGVHSRLSLFDTSGWCKMPTRCKSHEFRSRVFLSKLYVKDLVS